MSLSFSIPVCRPLCLRIDSYSLAIHCTPLMMVLSNSLGNPCATQRWSTNPLCDVAELRHVPPHCVAAGMMQQVRGMMVVWCMRSIGRINATRDKNSSQYGNQPCGSPDALTSRFTRGGYLNPLPPPGFRDPAGRAVCACSMFWRTVMIMSSIRVFGSFSVTWDRRRCTFSPTSRQSHDCPWPPVVLTYSMTRCVERKALFMQRPAATNRRRCWSRDPMIPTASCVAKGRENGSVSPFTQNSNISGGG